MKINDKAFCVSLVAGLAVTLAMAGPAEASTIATFADPATDGSMPLFEINLTADFITGGWPDSRTNLTLQVVYSGNTFHNAFFTMTDISYSGGTEGGDTGGGTIKFFADGQDTGTTPLIQIDFASAHITPWGFGGMDQFFANGVVITGSEIGGTPLHNEAFSFTFANQQPIGGDWDNGYTASAAFTSSSAAPVAPTPTGPGRSSSCVHRAGRCPCVCK